jgi:replication-associated recombination protein RarA
MDTLFANHLAPPPPLAEQLRPQRLDQVVGQPHLLGQGDLRQKPEKIS